ncbi:MAG TPA: hypothetical protein VFD32_05085 [Dehalococcoidia bacterium]|nr:hypothetical protein [Dehalococcoidia bacterium]
MPQRCSRPPSRRVRILGLAAFSVTLVAVVAAPVVLPANHGGVKRVEAVRWPSPTPPP